MTLQHSTSPWSYEYNAYTTSDGKEIPAFEVFDADANKIFDTNEDSPCDLQEANAMLAAAAPELLEALDYLLQQTVDQDLKYGIGLSEGEEDARAKALAAIAKAKGGAA